MIRVNNIVSQCVDDIIDELNLSQDDHIALKGIMLTHFGTALGEHAIYIDTLSGDINDENNYQE